MMNQKVRGAIGLVLFMFICEIAGVVGSLFTTPSIPGWYAALRKPNIAPPNWVFAPVWTSLYALMGISLFVVWRKAAGERLRRIAISTFILQLALNVLWSYLFFGLQSPILGMAEITILWLAIAATIALFSRISKIAAVLLLPYLAWVTFASYLTYMIFMLNP
jgi:benzodiazapine receptor